MDDLIKRQDAIEFFSQLWDCIGEIADKEEWEDVCKTTANEIPSAQQWTPYSEELPKTDNWRTTFNVTTETGNVTSMEWENTIVRGKLVSRWIWQDRIAPWEVVAWMPLPEPYKEEK